jgi:dTDP-4-amino-4,6-dideoxygalactose transaminase
VDRGDFILGQAVRDFEAAFAGYCGAPRAVGVDNGTSALELILRALGIGPGDEVIVPALTFVATASAVEMVGARPVFVDVDPDTGLMDQEAALHRAGSKTKAIIPVHLWGQPARVDSLAESARGKLHVIEDACQAHGARVGARRVGSIGIASAFSFYPAKNLGAFGDGGAVVTNDEGIATKVAMLRNYGEARKYEHMYLAYNRRLDTIQAAVLSVKLHHLDRWNAERRDAAQRYREALAGTTVRVLPEPASGEPVYHQFVVRSDRRDALAAHLKERGIETGVHYPFPLHLLPIFKSMGLAAGAFPAAEALAREVLSLPMFPGLTESEIDRVATSIKAFGR